MGDDVFAMRAIEFTTELGKQPVVRIPQEVAARLPKSGRARIIVLTPDDPKTLCGERVLMNSLSARIHWKMLFTTAIGATPRVWRNLYLSVSIYFWRIQ